MAGWNDCTNWSCVGRVDAQVTLSSYPPWLVVFLWLLTAIFSVETILGNLLVLLAYKLERNIRRQLSNKFIVSLAITDLIIGMEGFPLLTVYVVGRERWPLGNLLCQFWLFLDYTLCLVSILNVLLITIDRYGSVCYPAKYRVWQTRSRARLFIFTSWVIPCALFGMMIFAWEPMTGQTMDDSGKCYAPFLNDPYVNMAMYIIYYWTTLVAMSVLYRGIHTAAKALEVKSKARERQQIALLLGQRCMAQVGVGMLLHSSASDEDEENIESLFHPRGTIDYGYGTGDCVGIEPGPVPSTSATLSSNAMKSGYEQLREEDLLTGTSDSDEKCPLNVPSIRTPPRVENEEEEDVSVALLPLIDRSESKYSRTSSTGEPSPSPSQQKICRPVLTPMNSYGGVASIAATATANRRLVGSASLDDHKIRGAHKSPSRSLNETALGENGGNENAMAHDSSCSLQFYDKTESYGSLYGDASLHSVMDMGELQWYKEDGLLSSPPGSMECSMISAGPVGRNGDLVNSGGLRGSLTGSSICSVASSNPSRSSRGPSICPTLVPSSSTPAKLIHLADETEANWPVKSTPSSCRPSVHITISGDSDQLTPIMEEDRSSGPATIPTRPNSTAPPPKSRKRGDHKTNHLMVPGTASKPKYGLGFIGRRKASLVSVASGEAGKGGKTREQSGNRWEQRGSWQSVASCAMDETSFNNCKDRRLTGVSNMEEEEDSCGSGAGGDETRAGSRNEDRKSSKTKTGPGWLMNLFNNPVSILNRKRKVTKAERRARKAFRTITVIVGTFALFWSPYYIVATVYGFCPDCVPAPLFLTSYYLCYLNSSVNPFAYAFANRLFRKTFLRILRGDLRRT